MYLLHHILRKPRVSVCVPAYCASGFLRETLNSIAKQNFSDYEVLISVDLSTDASRTIAKQFARSNPRLPIKVFTQRKRLGWVDNINFLIAQSQAEFFCIVGHDDLITPEYLAELYECLQRNPEAVQAYCDIETFGDIPQQFLVQPSIRGELVERALDFLRNHYKAVSFRGLVRRVRIEAAFKLPHNACSDFSIDSLAILQLLLFGELLRVPKPLYKKRYHQHSTHLSWNRWDEDKAADAWLDHCVACLQLLKRVEFSKAERAEILLAAENRVLQDNLHLWRPELFRGLSDTKRHYLWSMLRASFIGEEAKEVVHG